MSRVLAYTSPARGHLYPIVATLIELRQRGHEVHVVTLGCEAAPLTAVGLRPHPLARAIEERPLDDWDAPSSPERLSKALATSQHRSPTEPSHVRRSVDSR